MAKCKRAEERRKVRGDYVAPTYSWVRVDGWPYSCRQPSGAIQYCHQEEPKTLRERLSALMHGIHWS